MKQFIATLFLAIAVPAMAHGPHNFGHRHYVPNWGWVAPTIIGGVVGYEIARNQQPVIVQQPVVIPPPVATTDQYCSAWTEIRNPDGTVTISRTCTR